MRNFEYTRDGYVLQIKEGNKNTRVTVYEAGTVKILRWTDGTDSYSEVINEG